jgi:hypothetical protein
MPTEPQRIGFVFGNPKNNGLRVCKHCGKEYTHKHHKQVYCSEPCRIASWEIRNGKSFYKK